MTPCFFDVHHHFLFGMDDGPRSESDMYRMLDRASEDGIRTLIATPHITPGVEPFDFDQYCAAFEKACIYCMEHHPSLHLYAGAEILYTDHTCRLLRENRVPTLNGSRYVLVEFSPDVSFRSILAAMEDLLSSGYLPVLAHAERYECLLFSLKRVTQLRNCGVHVQLNARSILKPRTFLQTLMIRRMLRKGLIDLIATDAHNLGTRSVCLTQVWNLLTASYDPAYIERIMCDGLSFNHASI